MCADVRVLTRRGLHVASFKQLSFNADRQGMWLVKYSLEGRARKRKQRTLVVLMKGANDWALG